LGVLGALAFNSSMAYDEQLAQRLRSVLKGTEGIVEKKMFSGISFCSETTGGRRAGIGPCVTIRPGECRRASKETRVAAIFQQEAG